MEKKIQAIPMRMWRIPHSSKGRERRAAIAQNSGWTRTGMPNILHFRSKAVSWIANNTATALTQVRELCLVDCRDVGHKQQEHFRAAEELLRTGRGKALQ